MLCKENKDHKAFSSQNFTEAATNCPPLCILERNRPNILNEQVTVVVLQGRQGWARSLINNSKIIIISHTDPYKTCLARVYGVPKAIGAWCMQPGEGKTSVKSTSNHFLFPVKSVSTSVKSISNCLLNTREGRGIFLIPAFQSMCNYWSSAQLYK